MALAVVVLACLLLTLAAHALLLMARTEALITRLDARRLEAGHRARARLHGAAARLDSLPPPTSPSVDPERGGLRIRRPSAEVAVLEAGPGRSRAGSAGAHVLLLYAPDPATRAARRTAGLRASRIRRAPGVTIEAERAICTASLTAPALLPGGPPPDPVPGGPPFPGIGGLDLARLLDRLPVVPTGRLEADPVVDGPGDCVPGPGNWGDPLRPGGGCVSRYRSGAAAGNVAFSGSGQGLLVVDGDLTLERDSHFRGWLVVAGTLRLEAGARLRGVADGGLEIVLEPGAEVHPDRCAGAEALDAAPGLRRPWRIGPPGWPVFPS